MLNNVKGIFFGFLSLFISALFSYNEMTKGVSNFGSFYKFILFWQISSLILIWGVLLNETIRLKFRSIFGVVWIIVCGVIFLYFIDRFEGVPYSFNEKILGWVFVFHPILWFGNNIRNYFIYKYYKNKNE